jgi:hypothetical protein
MADSFLSQFPWNINANGYAGELVISSVDAQGHLSGSVFGNPLIGFWDEAAGKITFMRIINPGDPSTFQVYTGFLFTGPESVVNEGDSHYTMAGEFEAFAGSGGTATRTVYGWYAYVWWVS